MLIERHTARSVRSVQLQSWCAIIGAMLLVSLIVVPANALEPDPTATPEPTPTPGPGEVCSDPVGICPLFTPNATAELCWDGVGVCAPFTVAIPKGHDANNVPQWYQLDQSLTVDVKEGLPFYSAVVTDIEIDGVDETEDGYVITEPGWHTINVTWGVDCLTGDNELTNSYQLSTAVYVAPYVRNGPKIGYGVVKTPTRYGNGELSSWNSQGMKSQPETHTFTHEIAYIPEKDANGVHTDKCLAEIKANFSVAASYAWEIEVRSVGIGTYGRAAVVSAAYAPGAPDISSFEAGLESVSHDTVWTISLPGLSIPVHLEYLGGGFSELPGSGYFYVPFSWDWRNHAPGNSYSFDKPVVMDMRMKVDSEGIASYGKVVIAGANLITSPEIKFQEHNP